MTRFAVLHFYFLLAKVSLFFKHYAEKIPKWSYLIAQLVLITILIYILLWVFLPLDPFGVNNIADNMNKSNAVGPFFGRIASIDMGEPDGESNFILTFSSEPIFSAVLSDHNIFVQAMDNTSFLNITLLNKTISDKLYDKKYFNLLFSSKDLFYKTFFSNATIKARIVEITDKSYMLSWDDIPRRDNGTLKEFLVENLNVSWIANAKIEKINNFSTFKISTRNSSEITPILPKLNNKTKEIYIEIEDVRTDNFTLKVKNDSLIIYKLNSLDNYYDNNNLRNLTLDTAFETSYLRSLCYIEAAKNDISIKEQLINDLYSNYSLRSLALGAMAANNETRSSILKEIYNNHASKSNALSIIKKDGKLQYQFLKRQHPNLLFFFIFIWNYWYLILWLWLLYNLYKWFTEAKKSIEINDFSYDSKYSDSTKKEGYDGIAALLSVELNRLRRLYQSLNENRPLSSVAVTNCAIPGAIRTGDVTDLTSSVFSDSTKLSFMGFAITGSFINSLIGWIIRRPKINGSLYKEGDTMILTARLSGVKGPGKESLSWRVECHSSSFGKEKTADHSTENENAILDNMISELAYRIFSSDLFLEESHTVPWKATMYFSKGLRSYRDSLNGALDRRPKLLQAIRFFEKALAEDEDHPWAHYNLGLAYTEMRIMTSAEASFKKAIHFHPDNWQPYYALAFNHYVMKDFDEAISLCDTALSCRLEHSEKAKIYDLMGLSWRRSWKISDLDGEYNHAENSLLKAVKFSLIGLRSASNTRRNERLALAYRCIKDLEQLLLEKEKRSDAECLLDLATKSLPNNPSPHNVDITSVDDALNNFSKITVDELQQLKERLRNEGNLKYQEIEELILIKSVIENDEV